MFLLRLLFSPLRIALFLARVVGYNRVLVFLLGVAVGLLCAPTTGAELRVRLREQLEGRLEGLTEPPVVASDLDAPRTGTSTGPRPAPGPGSAPGAGTVPPAP